MVRDNMRQAVPEDAKKSKGLLYLVSLGYCINFILAILQY